MSENKTFQELITGWRALPPATTYNTARDTARLECADEASLVLAALRAYRDKVQAFCFYWKEHHKRGKCKEMNGHYCCFCELADALEQILGP